MKRSATDSANLDHTIEMPKGFTDGKDYETQDFEELSSDSEEEIDEEIVQQDDSTDVNPEIKQPFIPGISELEADQVLIPDQSAYVTLHELNLKWPSLSFDVIKDNLGDERRSFPLSCMIVIGSQADQGEHNEITILRISKLSKTQTDSDDGSEDDEAGNDMPVVESRAIPISSCVNRIRYNPQMRLIASWLETGDVVIHDITAHKVSLENPQRIIPEESNNPVVTIANHSCEGFALTWSPIDGELLLTGDNDGKIYETIWTSNKREWITNENPFIGHNGSVEDIVMSSSEKNAFISCGTDGTIKVWNRGSNNNRGPVISVNAHPGCDINVLSWHKKYNHLLLSGADNGIWSIWDLRQWKGDSSKIEPIGSFDWHKKAITSLEWHPADDSILAVSSEDNQITFWDLSVEVDFEEIQNDGEESMKNLPSQLLFIHMGQKHIKEIHWHEQIPGLVISTAEDGLNIFKTISV